MKRATHHIGPFSSFLKTPREKSCLFRLVSLKLVKINCRSCFYKQRGGTKAFIDIKARGVSETSEEDFFASSPSANLAGINEGGH
jgi:hypothetical protein